MWVIFSFSFLVALTGAMSPGPLLTYTIIRTLNQRHRGYLIGASIIAGHAVIEAAIVVLLLAGLAPLLRNPAVVMVIGIAGGVCLSLMGVFILRDVILGRAKIDNPANRTSGEMAYNESDDGKTESPSGETGKNFIKSPVLGGMIVSMSNPYWWIWWATVGFAFLLQYNVSIRTPLRLGAFFLGHEAGDLAWYFTVSLAVHLGKRWLTEKIYRILLGICGIAIIGFGIFLGVSSV
jgi:threonine/homoserine/homoserine lactone efflux protein